MKYNVKIKNLTLGVILFSTITMVANSEEPIKVETKKVKTESIKIEPLKIETLAERNEEFVEVVVNEASQKEAEFLAGIVADWDVSESSKFDARNMPFTTIFKSNKGVAEVTYNNQGLVVAADQRLKNVVLPTQLVQLVSKRYEGWVIVNNKYFVTYKKGYEVEKTYQLVLQKGSEKKIIRMNV